MQAQTTARANLYYAQDDLRLRSIVETAGLQGAVVEDGVDGERGRITLRVGDATIELARMNAVDTVAHLEALHEYLSSRCGLEDPGLPARLKAARAAITVTIETGRERAGDCARFVSEVAARTGALVLREDGTIEDGEGRTLAYPSGMIDEEAPDGEPRGEPAVASPSADRVARRALVLVALAWRGQLEAENTPAAQGELAVWRGWLATQGLAIEMDDAEKTLVNAELGSLTERQAIHCGWAIEGAAVLAWGLRLLDLPAHDTKVSLDLLVRATGLFAPEPRAFATTLRPRAELAAMTARLFGISWRLLRFGATPGPFDFVGFSKGAWFGGFELRGIPVADGDLAIGGVPITRAEKSAVADATSIAVERYRAARWLEGRQATWSEAPPARR
jgi:hypothetical protein